MFIFHNIKLHLGGKLVLIEILSYLYVLYNFYLLNALANILPDTAISYKRRPTIRSA